MPQASQKLPHWDLSNVYPGLESKELEADFGRARELIKDLEAFQEKRGIGRLESPPEDPASVGPVLDDLLGRMNELAKLLQTLRPYIYSYVSTDSYNKVAAKRQSELEMLSVSFQKIYVRFEAWVGSLADALDAICEIAPVAREHRRALLDIVDESRFRMPTELEDLASELLISGGGAMWKLQSTVTSQLKVPFERDGATEHLPITVVRNLANSAEGDVRRRAYETEVRGWESIREPVAFALNGVKGSAITLSRRRGFRGVLHASLERNKIDQETLDALLASMRDSFPAFRRYFQSKAKKLGKTRLPWWDLFAPVGEAELRYSWDETIAFVVEQFGTFSDELADFAQNAFAKRWIDAEPRDGKTGGGFCMSVASVEESRILCNFDGSFDQLSTVAHELGHAFHSYCQKGLPVLRKGAPMTLAETASIMCETIVTNAALDAATPAETLPILENHLINASQVIVDIYSRFIFESEVMKRRESAELSADDFCEIMLEAQRETYGDGLDGEHLHPYMWLLKPHYYSESYNFYNYPYAFGLLFGLGVYAIYEREGGAFIPRYKELLRGTGEGRATDLAAGYGIDIRSRAFWDGSIGVLKERIERYCDLDG